MKRRGGDSNSRATCMAAGFQDRCNRPLCHLSGVFDRNDLHRRVQSPLMAGCTVCCTKHPEIGQFHDHEPVALSMVDGSVFIGRAGSPATAAREWGTIHSLMEMNWFIDSGKHSAATTTPAAMRAATV